MKNYNYSLIALALCSTLAVAADDKKPSWNVDKPHREIH